MASGELTSNAQISEIFEVKGWKIDFQDETVSRSIPIIDIDRLLNIGIKPKSVREVIGVYLEGQSYDVD